MVVEVEMAVAIQQKAVVDILVKEKAEVMSALLGCPRMGGLRLAVMVEGALKLAQTMNSGAGRINSVVVGIDEHSVAVVLCFHD